MKTVAVVQARMGSTRLPGKNGLMLQGMPQIWHVLSRIKRATLLDDVVLAVPYESNGGVLLEAARSLGVEAFEYCYDPSDVLGRHVMVAEIMNADAVVRIPGDNTFVDPDEIDKVVLRYKEDVNILPWKLLTTTLDTDVLGNGYPAGFGAEVYNLRFLRWLEQNVCDPEQREHPHRWAFEKQLVYTYKAPSWLNIHENPWLPHSFSVDTPADWEFTQRLYDELYPTNHDFRVRDIVEFLGEQDGK